MRRVHRRHQCAGRQLRLQRGDPRLQGVEIDSQRAQRAIYKSVAGGREQARLGRLSDVGDHQSRLGGPLPPRGVLPAGRRLDLLAILPGRVHRRHAGLLLQFPSPVSTHPPVRQLVEMVGARRNFGFEPLKRLSSIALQSCGARDGLRVPDLGSLPCLRLLKAGRDGAFLCPCAPLRCARRRAWSSWPSLRCSMLSRGLWRSAASELLGTHRRRGRPWTRPGALCAA